MLIGLLPVTWGISNVGSYLKTCNENIAIGLADPLGSALFNYYQKGEFKSVGNSISEGIGQGSITENLAGFKPDYCFQISDEVALPLLYDLMSQEGLYLGGSSAINVAGAIELARKLGKGQNHLKRLLNNRYKFLKPVMNRVLLL